MGRLKKEKPIVSVKTLTPEEESQALVIANQLKWPVNITSMQIMVPEKDLNEAMKNILVKTLQNSYKFSVQSTII